jgi:hypothetical protein
MTDDDPSIEQLIKQAAGAFEPSADLPERITRRVTQRQRHRRIAVSVCAALVAVLVVGGGLVIAGDEGPDSQLETASPGPKRSTTTTTSAVTSTTPPTGPVTTPPSGPSSTVPPSTPPSGANAATTFYVLHGEPGRFDEVSLRTGAIVRQIIPLEGFTAVEGRGDEEWWVRREPLDDCSGFRWEEYRSSGVGGIAFPVTAEATISPNGRYLAYVRTPSDACEGGGMVVVRDLESQAEAVSPSLVGAGHLTWRPDSDEVAFSAEEDPFGTGDETVTSVAVPDEIVSGGVLDVTIRVASPDGCSVGTPAFTADSRLTYVRRCFPGPSATTTIVEEGTGGSLGSETEVLLDDPGSFQSLAVNQGTGQVAFVADGAAWVVDGREPRKVITDALAVRWPLTIPG